jgi:hypothetical protein
MSRRPVTVAFLQHGRHPPGRAQKREKPHRSGHPFRLLGLSEAVSTFHSVPIPCVVRRRWLEEVMSPSCRDLQLLPVVQNQTYGNVHWQVQCYTASLRKILFESAIQRRERIYPSKGSVSHTYGWDVATNPGSPGCQWCQTAATRLYMLGS